MSDLPASGTRRRPIYDRLLRRRHHMLAENEPPTVAEISDAQKLITESTWDDDMRDEAFEVLRLADLPRSGDLKESRK